VTQAVLASRRKLASNIQIFDLKKNCPDPKHDFEECRFPGRLKHSSQMKCEKNIVIGGAVHGEAYRH
jgi:hypothetical protein